MFLYPIDLPISVAGPVSVLWISAGLVCGARCESQKGPHSASEIRSSLQPLDKHVQDDGWGEKDLPSRAWSRRRDRAFCDGPTESRISLCQGRFATLLSDERPGILTVRQGNV